MTSGRACCCRRGEGGAGRRRQPGLLARAALWALLALLGVLALALGLLGFVAGVGGRISPAGLLAGARPFLRIYEDAARVYQVSPFLLMAVHEDESLLQQLDAAGGRLGVNFAGCCAGPMQFYIAGGASPPSAGQGRPGLATGTPTGGPGWAGPPPTRSVSSDRTRTSTTPTTPSTPPPATSALGAGARLDSRSFQALVSYKGSPPASIPYARADYERARELQSLARNASETPSPPTAGGGRLAWPVVGPVVSPYGMRWGRLHAGIDIAVPAGTPIYAAATGRVTTKGWVGGYGNYTCLDHGRQISTCYAHQSRFGPTPSGGVLGRGQLVGWVGCTGHCFGPHLHFELRIAGRPIDPLPYLR